MPSQLDYDRYNMHYIYSPPWMRRGDREATDPAFLARTTPRRRALMGDYDRPGYRLQRRQLSADTVRRLRRTP